MPGPEFPLAVRQSLLEKRTQPSWIGWGGEASSLGHGQLQGQKSLHGSAFWNKMSSVFVDADPVVGEPKMRTRLNLRHVAANARLLRHRYAMPRRGVTSRAAFVVAG